MSYLKQSHIGNVAVRRVSDEGDQYAYKKPSVKFEDKDCSCHALRYGRGGDLHTFLVRHASFHPFIDGCFSGSSVLLAASISVRGIGAEAGFPQNASVTRSRRDDDHLAHFPPLPLASLATLRLGRISDAFRNGKEARS